MKLLTKIATHFKKWFFTGLILPFLIFSCNSEDIETTSPPLPANSSNKSIQIITDNFEGEELLIIGSTGKHFIVSFVNDKGLSFEAVQDELPVIIKDNEGTKWDIFGFAVNGDRKGERLTSTNSMMGYWFALGTFFPGLALYGEVAPIIDFTLPSATDGWLVSTQTVFGASVKDGIPALDDPIFIEYKSKNYLDGFYTEDDDLVLGLRVKDEVRLYPHPILNWHEIANDAIGGEKIAVVYCPLTGTASAWDRTINGQTTTFGVSGLLYNNNVVPYDRLTDSFWSQIRQDCISGEKIGEKSKNYYLIETIFSTWQEMYGQPTILSPETGIDRDYTEFPYGNYKTNELLPFPVTYLDKRLHPKERVHTVIINQKAKAYRFVDFN